MRWCDLVVWCDSGDWERGDEEGVGVLETRLGIHHHVLYLTA